MKCQKYDIKSHNYDILRHNEDKKLEFWQNYNKLVIMTSLNYEIKSHSYEMYDKSKFWHKKLKLWDQML